MRRTRRPGCHCASEALSEACCESRRRRSISKHLPKPWRRRASFFGSKELAAAANDLALAGRIRGAFGEELLRGASPQSARGAPCPWEPPCAFEALFRKQGRMTPGTDFPSPWVLSIMPQRDDLLVQMSLFGVGCEWGSAAAEALTVVLMGRVDWKGRPAAFRRCQASRAARSKR